MNIKTRLISYFFAALLGAITTFAIMACTQRRAPVIELSVQSDSSGRITSISTFYLDSSGKKVLHGESITWDTPTRKHVEKYRDGIKTEEFWDSVNY